jgi:hypothetical protein
MLMPGRFSPVRFLALRSGRPFIALLPGLLLAGCGGTPMPGGEVPPPDTIVQSETEPPPLQPYLVPPPPPGDAPGAVTWEFAHWHREGDNYIWVPGRYVAHPSSSDWRAGHWIYSGRTHWVWVPGRPD